MNEIRLEGDRDGKTFDHKFDYDRLNKQAKSVYNVMKDGEWRSLKQISEIAKAPEASVSARLRDFRKPKFGSLRVERKRGNNGLWFYRVIPDGCLL